MPPITLMTPMQESMREGSTTLRSHAKRHQLGRIRIGKASTRSREEQGTTRMQVAGCRQDANAHDEWRCWDVVGVNGRGDSLRRRVNQQKPCCSLVASLDSLWPSSRPFVPLRRQQPPGSSSLPPPATNNATAAGVSCRPCGCASSAHAGFMSKHPRAVLVLYYPPLCLRRRSSASAPHVRPSSSRH